MQGIRAGLALATLLMTGAAFGQTTYTGALTEDSPTFDRPNIPYFGIPGSCQTSEADYRYTVYSFAHTGGQTPTIEVTSTDIPLAIGFYRGTFDPAEPCANANAFFPATNAGATLNDFGPAGPYVLVVASQYDTTGDTTGSFVLSTTIELSEVETPPVITPPTTPQAVPVAGIPALALTGLGIFAAAGLLRTRRQNKAAGKQQLNAH